jgi:hypothetical protein
MPSIAASSRRPDAQTGFSAAGHADRRRRASPDLGVVKHRLIQLLFRA